MSASWIIIPLLLLSPFLSTQALPPPNDNLQLTTTPDTCPDYKTCSIAGRRYWLALQATIAQPHPTDRTDGKPLFDTYYETDALPLGPHGRTIRPDLERHGVDATKMTLYASTSKDPATGEVAFESAYGNIIDPVQGVIVAIENTSDFDEGKKLQWSEIVYQTWRRAMPAPEANLSTLRYSIQNKVDNPPAQAIIKLAYSRMGYPETGTGDVEWRRWTLAETPNWFYALLGTDNCKGTMWLLRDHAAEAGKKVVTEIWTRWPGFYPDIWYVCSCSRSAEVVGDGI
ncbi:MAG: hypothetical protein LQ346_006045 [Caloplaca aetnensis]|nr:MAG: hypothetical protein LQ346_006045 [Caloplaca aetnensis]